MFVEGCGQFETRGCHGKGLGPWSIPEASGFSQKYLRRLANVLNAIQKAMEDRLNNPGNKHIEMRENLSLKGSSIASTTDFVEEHRLQRVGSSNLHSRRPSRPEKVLEGRYVLTPFTAACHVDIASIGTTAVVDDNDEFRNSTIESVRKKRLLQCMRSADFSPLFRMPKWLVL
jgi:hypothetical protein